MCGIFGYITSVENDNYDDYFDNIKHRGPDCSSILKFSFQNYKIALGFHRLSIIDLENGKQPFYHRGDGIKTYLLCNGEIYNYKQLIKKYNLKTTSDCEVILEMYLQNMTIYDIVKELDGEFAFVLISITNNNHINIYYGRDRFGIRPLFYKLDETGFYFASELKGIVNCDGKQVKPRKIYHTDLYEDSIYTYYYIGTQINISKDFHSEIRDTLTQSVKDRMQSERPIGALLSGGLDSSLICGIASKILKDEDKKLTTFCIGMDLDSPDIENARKVAKYIGSIHHEIIIPVEQWIESLRDVIKQIETYDITTVRACTGQYLISKWISENTDIKVILNGDGSDELTSGYLYFYKAPDADISHLENLILLNQIHNYDVLRVDRGISAFGLESRVPFLSHKFVDLYLSIDKNLRNPIKGERMEKMLLRESFKNENIIPEEVLYRQKEAFSDAVSNKRKSWFEYIHEYIETQVPDSEFNHDFPSKEAYWYHKIYKEYYPESDLDVSYWMPKWTNEHNGDPSARKLNIL
jgi:asparagine synthase (glutamine-hydrolysing)